jgi:hypothetical protein
MRTTRTALRVYCRAHIGVYFRQLVTPIVAATLLSGRRIPTKDSLARVAQDGLAVIAGELRDCVRVNVGLETRLRGGVDRDYWTLHGAPPFSFSSSQSFSSER